MLSIHSQILSYQFHSFYHHPNHQFVLQTHHHDDHIGGTKELLQDWPEAEVIAAKEDLERIPFQTVSVKDGDSFSLMGKTIEVLSVPGHTKHHLAFYIPPNEELIEEEWINNNFKISDQRIEIIASD